MNGGMLYVFSFINSNGTAGLDDRIREQLIPALYRILSNNCNQLLDMTYAETPDDVPPEESEDEEETE